MAVENFTADWTERDPNGFITVTATKCELVNSVRNQAGDVYRNYGAGNIGANGCSHDFEVYGGSDWPSRAMYGWYVNDPDDDPATDGYSNVFCHTAISSSQKRLNIRRNDSDGNTQVDISAVVSTSTLYYCTMSRTGADTAVLDIYTDSGRTVLLDSVTVDLDSEDPDYVYGSCVNQLSTDAGTGQDGYVQNLEITEPAPPGPDRYYVGNAGAAAAWNNVNYWSLSSGGAGGASVPTAGNNAIFDANSPTCTLDISPTVDKLDLQAGFANSLTCDVFSITATDTDLDGGHLAATPLVPVGTTYALGTVVMGGGDVNINNSSGAITATSITISSGTFEPTAIGAVSVSGGVTMSGGALTLDPATSLSVGGAVALSGAATMGLSGISGNCVITGNLSCTGGGNTLTLPAGTIELQGNFSCDGTLVHSNGEVYLNKTTANQTVAIGANSLYDLECNKGAWDVVITGTCLVARHFLHAGSGQIDTGTLEVRGNVEYGSLGGGTGTLKFSGTADQSWEQTNAAGEAPDIEIAKTGGTLTPDTSVNPIICQRDFTYTSGTVAMAGTHFKFQNNFDCNMTSGALRFDDVTITKGFFFIITGTCYVDGDLLIDGSVNKMTTGTLELAGNLTVNCTGKTASNSATLKFAGTADQLWDQTGDGNLGAVEIAKAGGTLTLGSTGPLYFQRGFTYTSGNVDSGTSMLVSWDQAGGGPSATISTGAMHINDFTFCRDVWGATVVGTMLVDGDLNFCGSAGSTINGGTIEVQGDLTCADNALAGTLAITLDGAGDQIITVGANDLPNGTITINKATGSAVLAAALVLNGAGQNLTIADGELDIAGFNLTVPGTLTMAAGTILRLKGNETISIGARALNNDAIIQYYDAAVTSLLNNFGTGFPVLDIDANGGKTVTTTSGTTLTILTLRSSGGTLANRTLIRSTVAGNACNWDVTAEEITNNVDVSDNDASGGIQIVAYGSGDSGGNTNWLFALDSGSRQHSRAMRVHPIVESFTGSMNPADFLSYVTGMGGQGGSGGGGGGGGGAVYTFFVTGFATIGGTVGPTVAGYNPTTGIFDVIEHQGGYVPGYLCEYPWCSPTHFGALGRGSGALSTGAGKVLPVSAPLTTGSVGLNKTSWQTMTVSARSGKLVTALQSFGVGVQPIYVYESADGVTWTQLGAQVAATGLAQGVFPLISGEMVYFADLPVGTYRSIHSNDGGATWNPTVPNLAVNMPAKFYYWPSEEPGGTKVFCITDSGPLGGRWQLYSSIDKGLNWSLVYDALASGYLTNQGTPPQKMLAVSSSVLLVWGTNTLGSGNWSIWRSTDGGLSWAEVHQTGSNHTLIHVLLDTVSGDLYALVTWGAGNGARLLRSTDNGATWISFFADETGILGPASLPANATGFAFQGAHK